MAGPTIGSGQIRIPWGWWMDQPHRALSEEDKEYLNAAVTGETMCPRTIMVEDTPRARQLLGLEE